MSVIAGQAKLEIHVRIGRAELSTRTQNGGQC